MTSTTTFHLDTGYEKGVELLKTLTGNLPHTYVWLWTRIIARCDIPEVTLRPSYEDTIENYSDYSTYEVYETEESLSRSGSVEESATERPIITHTNIPCHGPNCNQGGLPNEFSGEGRSKETSGRSCIGPDCSLSHDSRDWEDESQEKACIGPACNFVSSTPKYGSPEITNEEHPCRGPNCNHESESSEMEIESILSGQVHSGETPVKPCLGPNCSMMSSEEFSPFSKSREPSESQEKPCIGPECNHIFATPKYGSPEIKYTEHPCRGPNCIPASESSEVEIGSISSGQVHSGEIPVKACLGPNCSMMPSIEEFSSFSKSGEPSEGSQGKPCIGPECNHIFATPKYGSPEITYTEHPCRGPNCIPASESLETEIGSILSGQIYSGEKPVKPCVGPNCPLMQSEELESNSKATKNIYTTTILTSLKGIPTFQPCRGLNCKPGRVTPKYNSVEVTPTKLPCLGANCILESLESSEEHHRKSLESHLPSEENIDKFCPGPNCPQSETSTQIITYPPTTNVPSTIPAGLNIWIQEIKNKSVGQLKRKPDWV